MVTLSSVTLSLHPSAPVPLFSDRPFRAWFYLAGVLEPQNETGPPEGSPVARRRER
ncbi:hypothetical protein DESC_60007 [Desulfosarcina cetonica]|nr:hypothetical protein DESC_60007 [Desulfosarcina cetonica]